MKKVLSLITVLALSVSLLAGCGASAGSEQTAPAAEEAVTEAASSEAAVQTQEAASETEESAAATEAETKDTEAATETEPVTVNVLAMKGPTAMGMVSLMDEAEAGAVNGNSYNFSILAATDEITPKLVQGEADIAAVPANLASVLYNNTQGGIQVIAINTLGVLYIVESGDSIQSAADLKGRTIYASGKGATPEYALNYILSSNGIDPETDVTIEWKSEHTECVSALAADPEAIAMLPQPFVTTAQAKNDQLRVALDLTEEWNRIQAESDTPGAMLTGVAVVRTAFAEEHPEAVQAFLASYGESVDYVNANVPEAAALIEKYDIVPAAVAQKALPFCNITCITGNEMKEKLSGYLNVLFEQNPKAVGGTLPADDFYYVQP